MQFHFNLILVLAFTFFASIQASPVRSFCLLYICLSLLKSFTPQVHLELLNSPDISVLAVRNEDVGLLFFICICAADFYLSNKLDQPRRASWTQRPNSRPSLSGLVNVSELPQQHSVWQGHAGYKPWWTDYSFFCLASPIDIFRNIIQPFIVYYFSPHASATTRITFNSSFLQTFLLTGYSYSAFILQFSPKFEKYWKHANVIFFFLGPSIRGSISLAAGMFRSCLIHSLCNISWLSRGSWEKNNDSPQSLALAH